jgi:hypothetical protein
MRGHRAPIHPRAGKKAQAALPSATSPKPKLFDTASLDRSTALLNQSAALRSVMLLSGENGVGKSALTGRWLSSLHNLWVLAEKKLSP